MKKKFISKLAIFLVLVSLLPLSALASDSTATAAPQEGAAIIAEYFIRDFQSVPGTNWSTDTKIVDTVTMYDSAGAISAYSFELETNGEDTGYVIISGYPELNGRILEFSDCERPVYDALNLSENDIIVYTGTLNYFKSTDNSKLFALNGEVIDKTQITQVLFPHTNGKTHSRATAIFSF